MFLVARIASTHHHTRETREIGERHKEKQERHKRDSREQRAESREQRAESREQKLYTYQARSLYTF
jgi:hypothetical protein